jgi:hypothetical protein
MEDRMKKKTFDFLYHLAISILGGIAAWLITG